ncbi:MAG: cob(I)yrinic acid a,c-diamide adenosyltransferase [Candidatus Euphemobacter frigidus]|nr:cob(I)yrinic acid a,c-diamide adenosyltransferase [Candidatus Euphemobacter frigidus]MDP8276346.1 cob(I)yrinic acid a,c-diamide adenosyltransferase [Candidatus Euphemobacter frigidus]
MIHIYTGNGKGKTTAAIGLALRVLGWGKRVRLIQFLKQSPSGELVALARFENCQLRQFGSHEFITRETAKASDRKRAEEGLSWAEEAIHEKAADLIILDEINVALDMNLLSIDRVRDLIAICPTEIELVLTGRGCPPEISSLADYVSEIREVKHPYQEGIQARKGIEF